jgi:hypothetical protein
MVKLTTDIGSTNRSVKTAIDTPSGKSTLGMLAEAATGALETEVSARKVAAANSAAKRQEAEAASAEAAYGFAIDYMSGSGNISSESDLLAKETAPTARRLAAAQAAVRQGVPGRTTQWLEAEKFKAVEELRARGVTNEHIAKIFKETGISDVFFDQFKREGELSAQSIANDRQAANETKAIERAQANGISGDSDYLAYEGRRLLEADAELAKATQMATLAKSQQDLNESQRKFMSEEAKTRGITAVRVNSASTVNGIMAQIGGFWAASQGRPEFESKMLTEVIPAIQNGLPAIRADLTQKFLGLNMSAGEVEQEVNLILKPVENMVASMQKSPERYTSVLKMLNDKHQLEYNKALPMIAQLENWFGPDITTKFLELNEAEIQQLIKEQGALDLSNPESQSIAYVKASQILKGKGTMLGEDTKTVQSIIKATNSLAESIAADIGAVDPSTVEMASNGFEQLALAANSVSVGSGERVIMNIANNMTGPTSIRVIEAMLSSPQYKDRGEQMVTAMRTGASKSLQTLVSLSKTSLPAGHELFFSDKTGRFELRYPRSAASIDKASVGRAASFGQTLNWQAGPDPSAVRQQEAANKLLSFLTATDKYGLEPIKGSPLQMKQYYATGKLPDTAKKTESPRKSAARQAEELGDALIEKFNRLPQELATAQELTSRMAVNIDDKPFGPLIKDKAQQYGVPLNIVTALLSVENAGLDPNAAGPEITNPKSSHYGDRAKGLFQLMAKTASGLGVNRDTVEGNIEGGIKLLAENYARTGNWRDAISMYHSGVSYNEAGKRHDGGMTTHNYVARILDRAGIEG